MSAANRPSAVPLPADAAGLRALLEDARQVLPRIGTRPLDVTEIEQLAAAWCVEINIDPRAEFMQEYGPGLWASRRAGWAIVGILEPLAESLRSRYAVLFYAAHINGARRERRGGVVESLSLAAHAFAALASGCMPNGTEPDKQLWAWIHQHGGVTLAQVWGLACECAPPAPFTWRQVAARLRAPSHTAPEEPAALDLLTRRGDVRAAGRLRLWHHTRRAGAAVLAMLALPACGDRGDGDRMNRDAPGATPSVSSTPPAAGRTITLPGGERIILLPSLPPAPPVQRATVPPPACVTRWATCPGWD